MFRYMSLASYMTREDARQLISDHLHEEVKVIESKMRDCINFNYGNASFAAAAAAAKLAGARKVSLFSDCVL